MCLFLLEMNVQNGCGHYSMQPTRHGLNWWFWCGHEASSTLPFCCAQPPLTPQNLHGHYRSAYCIWQLMRVLAVLVVRLRISTKFGVAFTDACKTCGRLWTDRTSLRLRSGNLDDFRRILRIPMDSDGSWRDFAEPLGFRGGVCALLERYSLLSGRVASLSASCDASQLESRLMLGFATPCVSSSTKIHI